MWGEHFPDTEAGLRRAGLGYFTYRVGDAPPAACCAATDLDALVDAGRVVAEPVVYEDFLPRSAAGIFSSNLTDPATVDQGRDQDGVNRDIEWLAGQIDRDIPTPEQLCQAQVDRSLRSLAEQAPLAPAALRTVPAAGSLPTRRSHGSVGISSGFTPRPRTG